jgi:acetylornithine deacetylase/succinyl-diaminopimelate desuccinylase-like protein
LGHRGNRFVELKFSGDSGHASSQTLYNRGAIKRAVNFLHHIPTIVEDCRRFDDKPLDEPSIVPSRIQSGDYSRPNQLLSDAYVSLDIRTTPKFDRNFHKWVVGLSKKFNFTWRYVAQPVGSTVNNKHGLVKKMLSIDKSLRLTTSPMSNDQVFFAKRGIDTIVFGPGESAEAHKTDEFVRLENIQRYTRIITKLIESL